MNTTIKKAMYARKGKDIATVTFFLLPALAIYGLYNVYGIVMTFRFSLLEWNGMGPYSKALFVGLDNYIKLMQDSDFWYAVRNNFTLVLVSIVFQLGFGMVLALIINSKAKGTRFLRTVYFMPMLLSTVATGILWQLLYDPYSGLINEVLRSVGVESPPAWLGLESTVMFAVLFVVCWQYTPQYMILIRAGMTSIPEELYDAATIDGASKGQQFWKVTLPLLSGTLKTSAVLSIVGSLKYFDLFYVMTGGGPNGYSELMATYMYQKAFNEDSMGFASSIAGSMFIISLMVVVIFLQMTKSKNDRKGEQL